ncbi:MAG: hypothetical protein ACREVG_02065, partial [Burkholderiales bacterium]
MSAPARPRGRPAKADALSPAERTRRYRERRRALGLKARVVWAPAGNSPVAGAYPSLAVLREARRSARER